MKVGKSIHTKYYRLNVIFYQRTSLYIQHARLAAARHYDIVCKNSTFDANQVKEHNCITSSNKIFNHEYIKNLKVILKKFKNYLFSFRKFF